LHLSEAEADEFVRDMGVWYCGELDTELNVVRRRTSPHLRDGDPE
jgi:hypothetical protein